MKCYKVEKIRTEAQLDTIAWSMGYGNAAGLQEETGLDFDEFKGMWWFAVRRNNDDWQQNENVEYELDEDDIVESFEIRNWMVMSKDRLYDENATIYMANGAFYVNVLGVDM